MKIYDITKFASQSTIKPELNAVYVKHIDSGIVYVATDTFRMCEVQLDNEDVKSIIKEGFYNLKQWSILAKETQKKNPDAELIFSISPSESKKELSFPDYEQIMPKETQDVSLTYTQFNPHFVSEAITFIEKFRKEPFDKFIKQFKESTNKKMFFFEGWDDDGHSKVRYLLMPLNK